MIGVRLTRRATVLAPLGALLLPGAVRSAVAQSGTPAPTADPLAALGLPELRVTLDPAGVTVSPAELTAGRYLLIVDNAIPAPDLSIGPPDAGATLVQAPAGMTAADLMTQLAPPPVSAGSPAAESGAPPPPPAWLFETVLSGGPYVLPGMTGSTVIELTAGEWVVWAQTAGPSPALAALTVTGEALADQPTPADPVRIEMVDFAFTVPTALQAGLQVIELENQGEQPHFLAMTGVPAGTTIDDALALFGMAGDPAATPASGLTLADLKPGFGTTLQSAGVTTWHATNLAPGTYLLACYAPDPDGVPHIMLGMAAIIEVQ